MDTFWEIIIAVLSGGAIGSLLTLRFSYKKLYAETVSQSRMAWINSFREEMSIVIAVLQMSDDKVGDRSQYIYGAEKARAKLLTRLNQDTSKPGNEHNAELADILSELDFKEPEQQNTMTKQLIDLTRQILEPEWQRVKREARGKKEMWI